MCEFEDNEPRNERVRVRMIWIVCAKILITLASAATSGLLPTGMVACCFGGTRNASRKLSGDSRFSARALVYGMKFVDVKREIIIG